jgi:hypothetical protein
MSLTELALPEVGGPCPSRGIQWACHCHCHAFTARKDPLIAIGLHPSTVYTFERAQCTQVYPRVTEK